jgi:hypothetical protein
MRLLERFDFKAILSYLQTHRSIVGGVAVALVLGGIYLAGSHEDQKAISYHQHNEPDFSGGRVLSTPDTIYKKKDRVISDRLEELENKIKNLNEELDKKDNAEPSQPKTEAVPEVEEGDIEFEEPSRQPEQPVTYKRSKRTSLVDRSEELGADEVDAQGTAPKGAGPAIISFPVKTSGKGPSLGVKLPSGSYVKAKLLTGVEAPEGKAIPVLLQADYAFIGPNKSKVDLSGCFLIAKSTGNLSIERVEMQTTKISCVSRAGNMFERPLSGFVADNTDNSFAVVGEVNSKQDRVAAMAFLSSVVAGISSAVAQAQTATVTGANGSSSLEITGDQKKYIAASGASNAASTVTQWYLKHAESLLPTINVGSGQDVWIVVQEPVELPNWYFTKHRSSPGQFEFLSKIID